MEMRLLRTIPGGDSIQQTIVCSVPNESLKSLSSIKCFLITQAAINWKRGKIEVGNDPKALVPFFVRNADTGETLSII